VKLPPKNNEYTAFLYGRYLSTDDMMENILILERELNQCQNENRKLKERLGIEVSRFKY